MELSSFLPIPEDARPIVAALAADMIVEAASFGDGRWGLTPHAVGLRVNVGWTEILTAGDDHLRLIVDASLAAKAKVPRRDHDLLIPQGRVSFNGYGIFKLSSPL